MIFGNKFAPSPFFIHQPRPVRATDKTLFDSILEIGVSKTWDGDSIKTTKVELRKPRSQTTRGMLSRLRQTLRNEVSAVAKSRPYESESVEDSRSRCRTARLLPTSGSGRSVSVPSVPAALQVQPVFQQLDRRCLVDDGPARSAPYAAVVELTLR